MKPRVGYANTERLANLAVATAVPQGFGEAIDGRDGERIGTNVATHAQWKAFFDNLFEAMMKEEK